MTHESFIKQVIKNIFRICFSSKARSSFFFVLSFTFFLLEHFISFQNSNWKRKFLDQNVWHSFQESCWYVVHVRKWVLWITSNKMQQKLNICIPFEQHANIWKFSIHSKLTSVPEGNNQKRYLLIDCDRFATALAKSEECIIRINCIQLCWIYCDVKSHTETRNRIFDIHRYTNDRCRRICEFMYTNAWDLRSNCFSMQLILLCIELNEFSRKINQICPELCIISVEMTIKNSIAGLCVHWTLFNFKICIYTYIWMSERILNRTTAILRSACGSQWKINMIWFVAFLKVANVSMLLLF